MATNIASIHINIALLSKLLVSEGLKNKLSQSRQKFNRAEANHIGIMLLVTDREHTKRLERNVI